MPNMAEDLAEYAVKKGSTDNISIVIICLEKKRRVAQLSATEVAAHHLQQDSGVGTAAAILLGGNDVPLSPRGRPITAVAPLSPRGIATVRR